MEIVIHFAARAVPDRGPAACGIVIHQRETAREIHEAGYFLGDSVIQGAAALQTLHKALELAADLSPDHLELHCPHTELIEQITTADPGRDAALIELHAQAMMTLLRFDHWHLAKADDPDLRRPRELAEQALRQATDQVDLTTEDAATKQKFDHTGVPQWTATLLDDPGMDCPALCPADTPFPFGPDTPRGFCVHAARIALDDGPLTWEDADQTRMTTMCPHCEVPMRLEIQK